VASLVFLQAYDFIPIVPSLLSPELWVTAQERNETLSSSKTDLWSELPGLARQPKTGVRVERPCARDASICRILQGDADEVSNT
jgi:hypothetical protein